MQNKTVCLSIHKDILKDSFKNTFVSYKKNILIISYKINDDILTSLMMWVKFDFEVNPSDSIYEILTFNFF